MKFSELKPGDQFYYEAKQMPSEGGLVFPEPSKEFDGKYVKIQQIQHFIVGNEVQAFQMNAVRLIDGFPAFFGDDNEIKVKVQCPNCHGLGYINKQENVCVICNGETEIDLETETWLQKVEKELREKLVREHGEGVDVFIMGEEDDAS